MTGLNANTPESIDEAKLPRRDWIVLPLLGLSTILLIAGSTELVGRWLFPWSRGFNSLTTTTNCLIPNDPSTGVRAVPNTVCWSQILETGPVQYKFNSCGHRAGMECGPKPPGTYRIVVVGSSLSMGYRVPEDQTITRYLPIELTSKAGRKVELYNESFPWSPPHTINLRFNSVLAAKPDMILWFVVNHDLMTPTATFTPDLIPPLVSPDSRHSSTRGGSFVAVASRRLKSKFTTKSLSEVLREQWDASRISFMLSHYLYLSQHQYVRAYLAQSDSEAGFLKVQSSAVWQDRVRQFDGVAAEIERRAQAAGVPLVAVYVPNRAQAAMISMGEWPSQYDPYKIGNEIGTIITAHGGTYVDILPDFRTVPNPEKYYLPIDGHPTSQGQALISTLLARELTSGAVPALRAVKQSQIAMERPR